MKRFFKIKIGQVVQAAGAAWAFLISMPARAGTITTRITSLRMIDWFLINIVMVGAVYLVAPQQIPILIFKACQVSLSGWLGYWFDRSTAPMNRPGNPELEPGERAAASIRRGMIIAAAMIAGALGA
jgi:hypothetical protein